MNLPGMRAMLLLAGSMVPSACTTAGTMDHARAPVLEDSKPIKFKELRGRMNGTGALLIPVDFGGHQEMCMLDTGAGYGIALATEFFKEHRIGERIWHWGVSGTKEASFVTYFESIKIGQSTI